MPWPDLHELRVSLCPRALAMRDIACFEGFQKAAKRRIPHMFYDDIDSGSWFESTYRADEATLQILKFRQSVTLNVEQRSTATQNDRPTCQNAGRRRACRIGEHDACGRQNPCRPRGNAVRHVFNLVLHEHLLDGGPAARTDQPFWFQLYLMRDRDAMIHVIDRCKAIGCSAWVLTLDI